MGPYYFGVEIELIAEPHHVHHPHRRAKYYQDLAESLNSVGERAVADTLDESYRKHREQYQNGWWITKDGSLGDPPRPQVPLEAVSPILSTDKDWEKNVDRFWSAVNDVFDQPEPSGRCGSHIHISPKPRQQFSLRELKRIAFGIIFYEPCIHDLLPADRRENQYCKLNTKHSSRLLEYGDYGHDDHDLSQIWEEIKDLNDEQGIRNYMQYRLGTKKDRYVLWNFDNIIPGQSGTVEFRGGCGLAGPSKTKQWISFVIAFIHLCLKMTSRPRWQPSMSQFWSDILGAANENDVDQNLPPYSDGMADSMEDDDDDDYGSIISKSGSEYSDSDDSDDSDFEDSSSDASFSDSDDSYEFTTRHGYHYHGYY